MQTDYERLPQALSKAKKFSAKLKSSLSKKKIRENLGQEESRQLSSLIGSDMYARIDGTQPFIQLQKDFDEFVDNIANCSK